MHRCSHEVLSHLMKNFLSFVDTEHVAATRCFRKFISEKLLTQREKKNHRDRGKYFNNLRVICYHLYNLQFEKFIRQQSNILCCSNILNKEVEEIKF